MCSSTGVGTGAALLSLLGTACLYDPTEGPSQRQFSPSAIKPHPIWTPHLQCKTQMCRWFAGNLRSQTHPLPAVVQFKFWIRVPLLAPDDLREDLIENEPSSSSSSDDTSVDEKTWTWFVLSQSTSSMSCILKESLLTFETVFHVIHLAVSGGTH